MENQLEKWIANWRAKRYNRKKMEAAYLNENSKYLIKAYKYSRRILKIQAVGLIGAIPTQKNFDFLLKEIMLVKDEKLKAYLYLAALKLASHPLIQTTKSEKIYLNRNSKLLKNIPQPLPYQEQEDFITINFKQSLKDHLKTLEDMKKHASYI